MIERGHQHRMTPVAQNEPGNGTVVYHFRCVSQPATDENPTPCRMEEERTYRDDVLVGVRVRVHGVWFHPFDLIRSLPLTVRECSVCGGDAPVCDACGGLGVEDSGGKLERPGLRVVG